MKKITSILLAAVVSFSTAFTAPCVHAASTDYENAVEFDWYRKISDTVVSSIPDQTYTGSYKTPSLTIKYKGEKLVKNKDYKVTYKNNKYIGTASAVIKGIGDYSGTKTVTFKIIPKTVTGLKATSTTSSISLSWTKVSSVSGYEVYRATSRYGTYTKMSTRTSTSYKSTSVSKTKTYYYKVRAYKTVNGKKYYGKFSSVVSMATTPSRPTITVKSAGSRAIKVSWNKISGAKGYEIYRKTGSSGSYTRIKTITSGSTLSYTNKSLTKGKTYYYKVRAYKIVNDKKLYSSYSYSKYIKCK